MSNQITFFVSDTKMQSQHPNNMLTLKKIQHFSYIITDQIGLGFSSHVYKGKNDLTNQIVAIKVIELKGVQEVQFLNDEVTALQRIKKAKPVNLLRLEGVFKTKNNLYIITQFCQGKDIAKILRKKKTFNEMEAQSILKQFLNGYRELYDLQIVHRDLKLANIFVKNGMIKIADFGFAIGVQACSHKMQLNVGSPTYMSPEALKYNTYSYKSDIWAIGVIAFELVYGRPPWKNKNDSILYEMLHNNPIEKMLTSEIHLSEDYKQFIKQCLSLDIDKRASPETIIGQQWKLANDFIFGMDKMEGGVKHSSLMKNINPKPIVEFKTNHKIQPSKPVTMKVISQDKGDAQNYRTLANTPTHAQLIQLPRQNQFRNTLKNFNGEIPQESTKDFQKNHRKTMNVFSKQLTINSNNRQLVQNAILSQIHYCRFMDLIYDHIRQNSSNIFNFKQLKEYITLCLVRKLKKLSELAKTEQNIFKLQDYNYYIRTEEWHKIKDIILQYQKIYVNKYHQIDDLTFLPKYNESPLINTIRSLKPNLTKFNRLVELLTSCYQLQQMDEKLSIFNFMELSKVEYLVRRKVEVQLSVERLNNRLQNLGF